MGPSYDHTVSLVLRLRESPADWTHTNPLFGRMGPPIWLRHGRSTAPTRTPSPTRQARWPLLQPFSPVSSAR